METPIQLYITLSQPYFTPTTLISGTIHIKSLTTLNLEKITLTLTKPYTASIISPYTNIHETNTNYKHTFTIFSSTSDFVKLSSGHHTYPFEFYLKSTDSGCTQMEASFGTEIYKIESQYFLEADVKVYGVYMPVINSKRELVVFDEGIGQKCLEMGMETSSCLCLVNERSVLRSVFDKDFYFSGERAYLVLDNDKEDIVSAEWYMYQVVSLLINDTFKTKSRLVHYGTADKVGDEVRACIPLFSDLASTVFEDKFEVKYVVQVVVKFRRKASVRYTQEIGVVRRKKEDSVDVWFDTLRGVDAMVQFFTLD